MLIRFFFVHWEDEGGIRLMVYAGALIETNRPLAKRIEYVTPADGVSRNHRRR